MAIGFLAGCAYQGDQRVAEANDSRLAVRVSETFGYGQEMFLQDTRTGTCLSLFVSSNYSSQAALPQEACR